MSKLAILLFLVFYSVSYVKLINLLQEVVMRMGSKEEMVGVVETLCHSPPFSSQMNVWICVRLCQRCQSNLNQLGSHDQSSNRVTHFAMRDDAKNIEWLEHKMPQDFCCSSSLSLSPSIHVYELNVYHFYWFEYVVHMLPIPRTWHSVRIHTYMLYICSTSIFQKIIFSISYNSKFLS